MTPNRENLQRFQSVLLDILTAIDAVCQEHNLRYYLIAGSMLGAVRHQGFIPWDDDADVALPRKDYECLVAHANEWLPEYYELVSGRQNPHFPYPFSRIQDKRTTYILRRKFDYVGGIPVDVFPLDGMTSNPVKRHIHYLKYGVLKRLLYYNLVDPYKHGHGLYVPFIQLFHKCLSSEWLHKAIDKVQKEFDYDTSMLVADHDNKPSRGILPKEVYGAPTPVVFAGRQLYGVQCPDTYLKYCYGEYMTMPKEIPPLNFRYLDMDTPYRGYKKNQAER